MTTIDASDKLAPIHLGEILMAEFIEGLEITQNKLAVSIGVSPRRINEIAEDRVAAQIEAIKPLRSRDGRRFDGE